MTSSPMDAWRIPLSRPDIDERDRRAVLRALESGCLSLGPEQISLEEEFRLRLEGLPCALVSSGTAGLYLALRALGVAGGEVITPSFGFIGTAHAIRLAGARPKFVDISPDTLCVTDELVASAWGPATRAVIPVHIFGTPCPIEGIRTCARAAGAFVVEDACEALGSTLNGRAAGTMGDAGVFAFYPNKQMTMGEGGLVVSPNPEVIERVARMRNQGRTGAGFQFAGEGFNFRLTEMQAALGRSQLARLDDLLAARARVAALYEERLRDMPGVATLASDPLGTSVRSWFVFPIIFADPGCRDAARRRLTERRIQTSLYFPPIHAFPPYDDPDLRAGELPVTRAVSDRSLALPFHSRTREDEIDEVVETIAAALPARAGETSPVSLPTLLHSLS